MSGRVDAETVRYVIDTYVALLAQAKRAGKRNADARHDWARDAAVLLLTETTDE